MMNIEIAFKRLLQEWKTPTQEWAPPFLFTEQKSYFKLNSKKVEILKSWGSITVLLSLM